MSEISHLSNVAAEKLNLSDEERIHHINQPHWIAYPRAVETMQKLEDLLRYPKQPRMPNMLLVGETNNGKTALMHEFLLRHPPGENADETALKVPVFYIQAPPGPDEAHFYNTILKRLFHRIKTSESLAQKRERVIGVLAQIELGMIVIDEFQGLIAGPLQKQRMFLNVIKNLGNELQVPIVGVGTEEAERAVYIAPQLRNRFRPHRLERWEDGPEFARLLASFESILPLKLPSNLIERLTRRYILAQTGGTIGEVSYLLKLAAVMAIRSGKEIMDLDILKSCGYESPT